MTLRNALLAVADSVRSIAAPMGMRINRLTIRTRTWSGGRVGLGTTSDVDLVLPGYYPVRYVKAEEVTSSGGVYELGDVTVNHITPSNGAGVGFTLSQLARTVLSNGIEVLYIITGEHAGEYMLMDIQTYRPFSYRLVLRRRDTTP